MFLWRGREGSPGRWMLQDCPRPPGCGCLPVTSTPCPAGHGCPLAGIGAPGRLGSVIARSWASRRLCHYAYRRDLRRHRAFRGAVPVACRPGVDSRGLRGRDAAAVARQRHQQQQLDVPAGQRAERARRGAGRPARHGQPVRDPGGGRAVRRAADAGRRDGAGRAAASAGHGPRRQPGAGPRQVARRAGRAAAGTRAGQWRQPEPADRPGGRAAREDRQRRAAGRPAGAPGGRYRRLSRPAEGVRQHRRQGAVFLGAVHHRAARADLPVADAGADHARPRVHLGAHFRPAGRRGGEARAPGIPAGPVPADRPGAGRGHRLRAVPGVPGPRGTAGRAARHAGRQLSGLPQRPRQHAGRPDPRQAPGRRTRSSGR